MNRDFIMRVTFLLTCILFVCFNTFSQEQSPLHQLNLSSVASSRYAPANLGTDFTKWQYAINAYAWFGNNVYNRATLEDYAENEIDPIDAVSQLHDGKNRGGAGVIAEPILFGYMITKDQEVRRGTHGR